MPTGSTPAETGDAGPVTPRFCPGCGRAGRDFSTLCDRCGESLQAQGYCPVCDRRWRLAEGEPCPKHDLPLESGPRPPHPLLLTAGPSRWVTVARFDRPIDTIGPRVRLESEGIPTQLDGERHAVNEPLMGNRLLLRVPEPLAAEASKLLSGARVPDPDLADEPVESSATIAPGDDPGPRFGLDHSSEWSGRLRWWFFAAVWSFFCLCGALWAWQWLTTPPQRP